MLEWIECTQYAANIHYYDASLILRIMAGNITCEEDEAAAADGSS